MAAPQPVSLTPPDRSLEPVVLTGSQFPGWSAGPEITARAPGPPTNYGTADPQGPAPSPLRSDCYQASPTPDVNGWTDSTNHGDHSCYQSSQLPVRTMPGRTGVDPQSLRGYRWTGKGFQQIPFQVDTRWVHYISNNASGFAFYSGIDQELTYTFDREGFRFSTNRPFDPANPATVCQAQPVGGTVAAADPNKGLIDTDEMALMARDAGSQAPGGARLPGGIVDAQQVAITDPVTGAPSYVYVMRSAPNAKGGYAVPAAFTANNSPYVRYRRDANADLFVYSQSSYSNYGNAGKGPVCNPDGTPAIGQGFKRDATGHIVLDPKTFVQRRPLDNATVTTPRYRFRYDGRWVMDDLQVSADDRGLARGDYGPNIVDRWKARAFQQTPGGKTPCCGYEEEQTNWGGSSILMGERAGPVRIIRATWGADSSTNNVRTEIFYPYEIRYQDNLRVHPIPPLDGIYTQRNMAAGRITRYYNPYVPGGVVVDGINGATLGKLHPNVGPNGISVDSQDKTGAAIRQLNGGNPLTLGSPSTNTTNCPSIGGQVEPCVYGDFDVSDPTFSGPPGELQWEEVDGPWGALVERWTVHQVTPAGTALAAVATNPYYRDDSCFDDGTGNSPGPKLHLRSKDEPSTWGYDPVTHIAMSPAPAGANPVFQRRCWNHHVDGTPNNIAGSPLFDATKPAEKPDPIPNPSFSPQGDIRYYEGDIATHGLHITFVADSDNAQLTTPVDEIDSEQREVVLHGNAGNVGERYGHSSDKPLVTTASSFGSAGPSAALLGARGAQLEAAIATFMLRMRPPQA
ncbi:MAG: hypothetical protein E6J14_14200 [Chloroflexi bacterium]|nr:MAG: hypothetical protein E6J14_14200 [Chloroflexota bacterium]